MPESSAHSTNARGPRADSTVLLEEDAAGALRQYRRVVTRRGWSFDIALASLVGVLGQLEAWAGIGETHRQGPLWAQALLYLTTACLLVLRRHRPLGVLAAIVGASVVEFALVGSPEGTSVALAPVIATYTVARREPWRRSRIALALLLLFQVAWAGWDPLNTAMSDVLGSMVWMALPVIAWLVGALLRARATNAEQQRTQREQQARQAVSDERVRIARELHDVIGHSVSVMTVQASAVRRRLDPAQSAERQALEAVEAVGREALTEMRRMVGVLRAADDTGLEPAPGLARVDQLIEEFRSAGLPVTFSVTGPTRAIAPGLDLTAYRLVQEGLTNTLRHACDPQNAEVAVDFGPDALRLVVRDDGAPMQGAGPADAPGSGLLGMRERVNLYGGSLEARRRPEGGFELVATLPWDPA